MTQSSLLKGEKMRHGYEWWEKFWDWLILSSDPEKQRYLKERKKQFEEYWREGRVQASP
jgi:hypothetical protein